MNRLSLLLLLAGSPAGAEGWVLETSTLTYRVTHPLHTVEGVSHQARGKGACAQGVCSFLVAAPVASFDSDDTSRDLHMQQVVRGGAFPVALVRARIPDAALGTELRADLEVEFAGKKARYPGVPFQVSESSGMTVLSGTIPLSIKDFAIEPPSLLSVPIRDAVPIQVVLSWKRK